MKTKKNLGYKIDHISKTITYSKKFAAKASEIGSEEYNAILELNKLDYKAQYRETAKKKTYKGLTIEKMTSIIREHDENPTHALYLFGCAQKAGSLKNASYASAKKWFLDRCQEYSDRYAAIVNELQEPELAEAS